MADTASTQAVSAARARSGRGKEFNFAWEGRDRSGNIVRGETRAIGEAMVSATLRRQGVMVTKIRKRSLKRGGKIKDKDIALFTRQLATMLKAGVPLLQSFDIVAKGASNAAVGTLFSGIRADIETGSSMAAAFAKHPLYFDALYCNLIAAGEQAGILDELLERLASYREKMLAIKAKIKTAMFYPTAVLAVAFIVVTVIMLFVVPSFKQVFSSFGADLPAPTLFVIAISDFFVEYWYLVFGVIGGGIYFFMQAWRRSAAVQIAMDRLLLKLPIFGPIVEKATIARWLRTLSTMFAAGVPLVEALDSVGGAAGNNVFLIATRKIQQEVTTGTALTTAMEHTAVFPNLVLQMSAIGEESGALDSMLSKAADMYESDVDEAVASLSTLLEPIILVVLGTLIGGMVVAMYLPIFKLGQVV